MPNHVTNHLSITSNDPAELETFVAEFIDFSGPADQVFSLNKVIPMPEGLNIESGSRLSRAVSVLAGQVEPLGIRSHESGINDPLELIRHWAEDDPEMLLLGAQGLVNLKKHRHRDWYSWSIANWGTKWDCYSVNAELSSGHLSIQFFTAWSPPSPVLVEIARRFPGLQIAHKYVDEGLCFWGADHYEHGVGTRVMDGGMGSDVDDEAKALILELMGEDALDYEEEDSATA